MPGATRTTRKAAIAAAAFVTVLLTAFLVSPSAAAKTLAVGAGRTYAQPSAAIAAAAPGDTVEVYPGTYIDCAIVSADRLTIVGIGDGVVIADRVCQGKGILVAAARDLTVRNVTLSRARAPALNGAGIRGEGTNLTVDHVRFIDNENGILSGVDIASTIRVVDSMFDGNGNCTAACAHGIYAGHVKLLHVENSVFSNTHEGHHIKSRAERTEVIGTRITDGQDGSSSYLVEAPNGGSLVMLGNVLEKGPRSENRTAAVVIGAEGVTNATIELIFRDNSFTNDTGGPTIFVRNLTATPAQITGSKYYGSAIIPLEGEGTAR